MNRTTTSSLVTLIRGARYLLLDFDGPVCAVFGSLTNRQASKALCLFMHEQGIQVPDEVLGSPDPFDVLRYAGRVGEAEAVEQELRRLEIEAVATAPETPHAFDVLREAHKRGMKSVVVSNNSAAAVREYLARHQVSVDAVASRKLATPELLKPSPHLLQKAMTELGVKDPQECLFVGDSVSDIQAGQAIGVPVVAFVNKPKKHQELNEAGPSALITSMAELASAISEADTPTRGPNIHQSGDVRNTSQT